MRDRGRGRQEIQHPTGTAPANRSVLRPFDAQRLSKSSPALLIAPHTVAGDNYAATDLIQGSDLPRPLPPAALFAVFVTPLAAADAPAGETPTADAPAAAAVDFQRDVQPILAKHCLACHGPDEAEAGLSLTGFAGITAELDSGEHAVVPHEPDASELIARVSAEDEYTRMPPEGDPLSPAQIDTLRRWIAAGAGWSEHWAFVPPEVREPPADAELGDPAWVRNGIDRFVLARLDDAGPASPALSPNPEADRRTLIRRVAFDLTGLPPTPEEVAAFVADPDPLAYEKLVDRLLESPRHGERWARHWLDLVRFAETNSYERDGTKPNAWKYRDYVIRAFNEDKPYDRFILEQLAGDELPDRSAETVTATGYYRLGIWDDEPADPEQAREDGLDDVVRTTGEAFLGLTVGCARCHDHKLDPIPQADYYRMTAVFRGVTEYGRRGRADAAGQVDITDAETAKKHAALDREAADLARRLRDLEQAGIAKMSGPDQRKTEGPEKERTRVLEAKLRGHLTDGQWDEYLSLRNHLAAVRDRRAALPPRETTLAVSEVGGEIPPTHILARGNAHAPGEEVEPGVPDLFDSELPPIVEPDGADSSGRRLAFARWVADADNLLTARVAVNRVWQHHFGRGLVRSANNFGKLGTPPTHPALLDWLADRFTADGWSLKSLHRLIVTSATYRQSSAGRPDGLAADPANDRLWRFDLRRLSAEELRDASLAVTGELNPQMFGPGFYPQISKEVLAGQSRPGEGWGESPAGQRARRSVYIFVKRSLVDPTLAEFDFPETDAPCESRFNTTQPGQSLSLLNGDFQNARAVALADRLERERPGDRRAQLNRAIELVLGRAAGDGEVDRFLELHSTLTNDHGIPDRAAFELCCLAVMNLNEFLYLD